MRTRNSLAAPCPAARPLPPRAPTPTPRARVRASPPGLGAQPAQRKSAPELAPHASCPEQAGSRFPEQQFPVSSFLIDTISPLGLPRGSDGGRGRGWGNPRLRRARSIRPRVAGLFLPGNFELCGPRQGLGREGV